MRSESQTSTLTGVGVRLEGPPRWKVFESVHPCPGGVHRPGENSCVSNLNPESSGETEVELISVPPGSISVRGSRSLSPKPGTDVRDCDDAGWEATVTVAPTELCRSR